MFNSRTPTSKDCWETPADFFSKLDAEFHFTLDPCASDTNHKCAKYYTEKEDGLKQSWANEVVFVNPPFSKSADFTKKCYEESVYATVVEIIPSRTDTKIWHRYCMRAAEIRFCVGRVNFLLNGVMPKNGSNFPLAVIVFRYTNEPVKVSSYVWK